MEARAYYEQTPQYSSTCEAAPAITRDFFHRLFQDRGHCRILDVGCGYGADARVAEGFGHDVVGVELSEKSLRKFCKGPPEREGVLGDILELKHNPDLKRLREERSFDAIFCGFVLIHLDVELRVHVMTELRSALEPGGRILLSTNVWQGPRQDRYTAAHRNDPRLSPTTFHIWPEAELEYAFSRYFSWDQLHRLGRFPARERKYWHLFIEGRARP